VGPPAFATVEDRERWMEKGRVEVRAQFDKANASHYAEGDAPGAGGRGGGGVARLENPQAFSVGPRHTIQIRTAFAKGSRHATHRPSCPPFPRGAPPPLGPHVSTRGTPAPAPPLRIPPSAPAAAAARAPRGW